MRANLLLLFIILAFSAKSFANFSCHLTQQLGNPKVASDAKFWEEFGKISDKGNDHELASLLKRYDVDARASHGAASPATSKVAQTERRAPTPPAGPAYQMNHTAKQELRSLQPGVREKASEFLELAKNGSSDLYAKLRANQGRWQLEHLNGKMSDLQSVRLNGGYRAVFRERADHSIEIVNFSKTATHSGH